MQTSQVISKSSRHSISSKASNLLLIPRLFGVKRSIIRIKPLNINQINPNRILGPRRRIPPRKLPLLDAPQRQLHRRQPNLRPTRSRRLNILTRKADNNLARLYARLRGNVEWKQGFGTENANVGG